jgi:AraC family ethanolamine operon transcriptional activator
MVGTMVVLAGCSMPTRRDRRYEEIVRRFEQLAQNDWRTSHKISDLCAAAAIDHQTLLRAFRLVRNSTPSTYLRDARMKLARRALLSAEIFPQSVTEVAMQFGFRELGRFAADYRSAFGERPSDTLRRTARKRGKNRR